MNKIKTFLILLLVMVFLSGSLTFVRAEEALLIDEILILGASRTADDVIRGQLPFTEGDYWQEEFSPWTIRRLATLNIFSYEPLQVLTEPLGEGKLRVVIRMADPSLFYLDPAEFAIMTTIDLVSGRFQPVLYNPLGRGFNVALLLSWNHNYIHGIGISFPFYSGKVTLQGQQYMSDVFNYQSQGRLIELGYRYWFSERLRTTIGLSLHSFELNGQQQEFIKPSLAVYHSDIIQANTVLKAGVPLNDEQPFYSGQTVFFRDSGNFHGLVRLGYTTEETPDNHRFIVGGFSELPLRAENMFLSDGYLLSTVEYHYQLNPGMRMVTFLDGGRVYEYNSGYKDIFNIGAGLAMDTPLGLPVRFDVAFNPQTGNRAFNLGFGFSFRPPM